MDSGASDAVIAKNPEEAVLEGLLAHNATVFCLSIDSFLKFQLKRKPLGQDGTAPFLKAAKQALRSTSGQIDDIIAAGLRYAYIELECNAIYSAFEGEPRAVVHADLVKACMQLAASSNGATSEGV